MDESFAEIMERLNRRSPKSPQQTQPSTRSPPRRPPASRRRDSSDSSNIDLTTPSPIRPQRRKWSFSSDSDEPIQNPQKRPRRETTPIEEAEESMAALILRLGNDYSGGCMCLMQNMIILNVIATLRSNDSSRPGAPTPVVTERVWKGRMERIQNDRTFSLMRNLDGQIRIIDLQDSRTILESIADERNRGRVKRAIRRFTYILRICFGIERVDMFWERSLLIAALANEQNCTAVVGAFRFWSQKHGGNAHSIATWAFEFQCCKSTAI